MESAILSASENNRCNALYINHLRSYASAFFSTDLALNSQSFSDKNIAINNIFLTSQLNLY